LLPIFYNMNPSTMALNPLVATVLYSMDGIAACWDKALYLPIFAFSLGQILVPMTNAAPNSTVINNLTTWKPYH